MVKDNRTRSTCRVELFCGTKMIKRICGYKMVAVLDMLWRVGCGRRNAGSLPTGGPRSSRIIPPYLWGRCSGEAPDEDGSEPDLATDQQSLET